MAAKPRRSGNTPRKTLKQSLKDVFLRRLRKSPIPHVETVGSGILRKGGPSSSFVSSVWTLSPLEADDSVWSLEQYNFSHAIPNRFETPTERSTSRTRARQSLLPATSISQFNQQHLRYRNPTASERPVHQAISQTYTPLSSQQASIATISHIPSVSTLRLQDSRLSLAPREPAKRPASPSSARTLRRNERRGKQVSWLDSAPSSSISVRTHCSVEEHAAAIERPACLRQVEHFKSFCVLDTAMAGCPVVATSQELRYIFEIGEHFFLNSCECEGASMDIVTGQDAAGDPVTHLVLFTPLVIPSSGRSRFMLVSLVDVTRFIHETAALPEFEKLSESSTIESDPQTPLYNAPPSDWAPPTCKLSAEDLLGGCVLPEDRNDYGKPTMRSADDVWLNLANEEKSRTSTARNTPRSTCSLDDNPRSSDDSRLSKTSTTVDDVLEDFMTGLRELYSDFFLLGKSPLDDTYYEICNVSPMLYAARDYIHGHLSRTGQQGLAELSARLAQDKPFQIQVKWGLEGVDRRLYCSPLYGHNTTTWICFLVDPNTPELW
ncbi:hypothetical protein ABEF95_013527 [Exophiala dermatitidis]